MDTTKHDDAGTSGSGGTNTGGSRAGLFRTPISGGVHSATAVHDLPPPALAVRNLMEQVCLSSLVFGLVVSDIERGKQLNMDMRRNL
jgi:hypothetical protein